MPPPGRRSTDTPSLRARRAHWRRSCQRRALEGPRVAAGRAWCLGAIAREPDKEGVSKINSLAPGAVSHVEMANARALNSKSLHGGCTDDQGYASAPQTTPGGSHQLR